MVRQNLGLRRSLVQRQRNRGSATLMANLSVFGRVPAYKPTSRIVTSGDLSS